MSQEMNATKKNKKRVVGVEVESCHRKWRQIGWNADETFLEPQQEAEDFSRFKALIALDGAIQKIRLATLFPQIAKFVFRRVLNQDFAKDLVEIEADCIESAMGSQFIRQFIGIAFSHWKNAAGAGSGSGMSTNKKLLLYLQRGDKSQREFLKQLLNNKHLIFNSLCDVSNKPQKFIVPVLKKALKGRYASHVKDAIKQKDMQSLICILSIIAQNWSEEEQEQEEEAEYSDEFLQNDPSRSKSGSGSASGGTSRPPSLSESLSKFIHANLDADSECRIVDSCCSIDDSESAKVNLSQSPFERPLTEPRSSRQSSASYSSSTSTVLDVAVVPVLSGLPELPPPIESYETFAKRNLHLRNWLHQLLTFLHSHPNLKDGMLEFNRRFASTNEGLDWNVSPAFMNFLNMMEEMKCRIAREVGNRNILDLNHDQDFKGLFRRDEETEGILVAMQEESRGKQSKWKSFAKERDQEIESLQMTLKKLKVENEKSVYESVEKLAEEKLINDKLHDKKMENLHSEAALTKDNLNVTLELLNVGYKGLRNYRKGLERELRKATEEYEECMQKQEEILTELRLQERKCGDEVDRLQKIFSRVEERYDEMRNTRRLKELLKSLQMAESVRENWAARRIQLAWRRYKTMKLRKRRLKKPGKGKKKKGDEDAALANKPDIKASKKIPKQPSLKSGKLRQK